MTSYPIKKTVFRGVIAALLCLIFQGAWIPQALAQRPTCDPFTPCIIPFTPNDPFVRPISPNEPGAPNAAKTESNVCDADYMNQIYGNAFLESQRETISAEAIMLKPDSVLEYTCFDQLASQAAIYAPRSFSFSTGALPHLIQGLVLEGLLTYIDENFWHTFLGGAASGLDTTITNQITSGGYTCSLMNEVWMVAKCSDFGLEAPFMTFEELIDFEPRQLPQACTGGTKITVGLIALANNEPVIDLYTGEPFSFVYFDYVNSLLSKFKAGKTFEICDDQRPIPTGVIIQNLGDVSLDIFGRSVRASGSNYNYEDKVCPNPACWFDHKGNADSRDDRCVALPN